MDKNEKVKDRCSDYSIRGCPASSYLICPAYKTGKNCWEAEESIPCCKRKDKSRCPECDVYQKAEKLRGSRLTLNSEEIKEILPHREPFLFLDEASIDEEGITGYYQTTGEEDFFKGHFPEDPIMPEVLILKALVQAGTLLILQKNKRKKIFVTTVDKVKFRTFVVPGNQLILKVKPLLIMEDKGKMLGTAFVKEKLVCEGTFSYLIPPEEDR